MEERISRIEEELESYRTGSPKVTEFSLMSQLSNSLLIIKELQEKIASVIGNRDYENKEKLMCYHMAIIYDNTLRFNAIEFNRLKDIITDIQIGCRRETISDDEIEILCEKALRGEVVN